ncbi:MAG: TonB-dependent receptor [Acidobacteriia bacterium]|nr:TonB-dependent receptor [Terriglobia bacterium]
MSTILKTTLIGLCLCAGVWAQAVSTSQISGVVQDSTGLVVPGATVTVTQTATGLTRTTTSGGDGSYVLPNLPVGPYRLQVTKEGFNAAIQSGIVLQVDTNPVINVTLKVGSVSEQVVVEASAGMVETHQNGVGQVIDQQRVVDLPLNGRQATDLIYLSGGATTAPAGDLNSNKNYPTTTISVGGGLPNAVSFVMDGASNNDPFNNLNLPFPFPDALQEFKVETSAVPARYGQHAAAAVNVVTKTGTNEIHGDVFEFFRNSVFNARDFFATSRDSLKRNQFGGTVGGPIKKDKLFFFAGYQGTIVRSDPPTTVNSVVTQDMLNGDFSTLASPVCQGKQVTLKAPFVNNKISPSQFSQPALNFLKHLPISADPCGKIQYGIVSDNREHQILGRVDYSLSPKNQLFGRYFIANYNNPVTYDPANVLTANKTGVADQSQSLALGDNYTFTPNTIAATHLTVNRTRGLRVVPEYFTPTDLGVNMYSSIPGFMGIGVGSGTSGFSLGGGATNPGYFNSTAFQGAEDIDLIRGSHQIAFGVNYIRAILNSDNNRPTNGQFTFNGQVTGLAMTDFLTGVVSGGFLQGNTVLDNDRANFVGLYVQDSWKVTHRLSLNYGVRWEPFLPENNANGYVGHFDPAAFAANVFSTAYKNAPAGLSFPGDKGYPGKSNVFAKKGDFAPRVGLVWDPKGDGKMTVRASYGIFYDTPQLFFYTRFANNPPWGAQVSLPSTSFQNPWATYPGGNPFPGGSFFPNAGVYVNMPLHVNPPYVQQWNLSVQRQVGANLLLSASYFGNKTTHMWTGTEGDPALPVAGATLATENQHRVLYLQNPAQGTYYSTIGQVDDGGNSSYNGLLLVAQRRLANNVSVLGNFTWSHCIGDAETTEITGPTYVNPSNRAFDRANCSSDRRRILNLSMVANSPKFGNKMMGIVAGGWQLSAIVRYQSGNYTTATTGVDNALSGIGGQRPNQILADPYTAMYPGTQTFSIQYLNRSAFTTTGLGPGILGDLRPLNLLNPNMIQVDMGLSRNFRILESRNLQFRWEVFNVPNRLNAAAPNTNLNAGTFGQITSDINGSGSQAGDPRIMQLALKFSF